MSDDAPLSLIPSLIHVKEHGILRIDTMFKGVSDCSECCESVKVDWARREKEKEKETDLP